MTREVRSNTQPLEMRGLPGQGAMLTGYAAVFNSETSLGYFREMILPGAFKRTLKATRNIFSFFNHNPDNLLGSTQAGSLTLAEDDTGLRYDLAIDDTDIARRVYRYVETREVTGSSFAFDVPKGGEDWDKEGTPPLRRLSEVRLYEAGPVVMPAYLETSVDARQHAALAFRSLSETTGWDINELIQAAEAGELPRLLVVRSETTEDPVSGPPVPDGPPAATLPPEPTRDWRVKARRLIALAESES